MKFSDKEITGDFWRNSFDLIFEVETQTVKRVKEWEAVKKKPLLDHTVLEEYFETKLNQLFLLPQN